MDVVDEQVVAEDPLEGIPLEPLLPVVSRAQLAVVVVTGSFVAGLLMVAYGAWLAWPPAGFLVAGFFLILLPVLWVRGQWASSTG